MGTDPKEINSMFYFKQQDQRNKYYEIVYRGPYGEQARDWAKANCVSMALMRDTDKIMDYWVYIQEDGNYEIRIVVGLRQDVVNFGLTWGGQVTEYVYLPNLKTKHAVF